MYVLLRHLLCIHTNQGDWQSFGDKLTINVNRFLDNGANGKWSGGNEKAFIMDVATVEGKNKTA